MSKVTLFMERFWLAVAIATAIYTLYLWFNGNELSMIEYALPVVALMLFYVRRRLRLSLEKAKKAQEEN